MSISIRKLQQEDTQKIKDLKLESLKEATTAFDTSYEEAVNWSDDRWTKTIEDYLSPGEGIFIVAEDQGELIGFIHVRFLGKKKKEHIMEFATLYVIPQYRSKGFGTKLLETVLKEIREKHPKIIKIQNSVYEPQKEALALYKRVGFKVYGEFEKELCVDGKYYKQIALELFL